MVCKLFPGFSSRPPLPTSFVNLHTDGATGTPVFKKPPQRKQIFFKQPSLYMQSFENLLFLRSQPDEEHNIII
jgi:hypothetical protein